MAKKVKQITTMIGIITGVLAILHSSYDLYQKYTIRSHVESMSAVVIDQKPVLAKTIVIEPQTKAKVKVDVSFKIFKTGDIIIESGATRKYLPFALDYQTARADWLVKSAFADEVNRTINGTKYKVRSIKYIEVTEKKDPNTLEETKKFEDGTVEVKRIDLRSNEIVSTISNTVKLTPTEKTEIRRSQFSKEVFVEVAPH
jgi:hypothetical protein